MTELLYKILENNPSYKSYLNEEKDFCINMEHITEEEKQIILNLLRYGLVLKYCCIDGEEWLFLADEDKQVEEWG